MEIIIQLFLLFFKISILTFGGGYAMVPLFQLELVDKACLINGTDFANMVALSQMTPGPVCLNAATYIGYEQAGVLGAIGGTLGVAMPSLILVPLLFYSMKKVENNPYFKGVLQTIRPIVLGLIFAAVIFFADSSMFTSPTREAVMNWDFSKLGINWNGLIIFVMAMILGMKTKINVIYLLLISGASGIGLYYLFGLF